MTQIGAGIAICIDGETEAQEGEVICPRSQS